MKQARNFVALALMSAGCDGTTNPFSGEPDGSTQSTPRSPTLDELEPVASCESAEVLLHAVHAEPLEDATRRADPSEVWSCRSDSVSAPAGPAVLVETEVSALGFERVFDVDLDFRDCTESSCGSGHYAVWLGTNRFSGESCVDHRLTPAVAVLPGAGDSVLDVAGEELAAALGTACEPDRDRFEAGLASAAERAIARHELCVTCVGAGACDGSCAADGDPPVVRNTVAATDTAELRDEWVTCIVNQLRQFVPASIPREDCEELPERDSAAPGADPVADGGVPDARVPPMPIPVPGHCLEAPDRRSLELVCPDTGRPASGAVLVRSRSGIVEPTECGLFIEIVCPGANGIVNADCYPLHLTLNYSQRELYTVNSLEFIDCASGETCGSRTLSLGAELFTFDPVDCLPIARFDPGGTGEGMANLLMGEILRSSCCEESQAYNQELARVADVVSDCSACAREAAASCMEDIPADCSADDCQAEHEACINSACREPIGDVEARCPPNVAPRPGPSSDLRRCLERALEETYAGLSPFSAECLEDCAGDVDCDGVVDPDDNCPHLFNPGQVGDEDHPAGAGEACRSPRLRVPHGDPSLAPNPTWGANETNEWLFTADESPQLTFQVVLIDLPAGTPISCGLSGLADAQLVWLDEDGQPQANCDEAAARVRSGFVETLTFRGLLAAMPGENDWFGRKMLSVCFEDPQAVGEVCATQLVEIFWPLAFDPHATLFASPSSPDDSHDLVANHPAGRGQFEPEERLLGSARMSRDPAGIPNFVHYWSQVAAVEEVVGAPLPPLRYVRTEARGEGEHRVATGGYYLSANWFQSMRTENGAVMAPPPILRNDIIAVTNFTPVWPSGARKVFGLAEFTGTIAHEIQHVLDYVLWTDRSRPFRLIDVGDQVGFDDWSFNIIQNHPLWNHRFDLNGDGEYYAGNPPMPQWCDQNGNGILDAELVPVTVGCGIRSVEFLQDAFGGLIYEREVIDNDVDDVPDWVTFDVPGPGMALGDRDAERLPTRVGEEATLRAKAAGIECKNWGAPGYNFRDGGAHADRRCHQ